MARSTLGLRSLSSLIVHILLPLASAICFFPDGSTVGVHDVPCGGTGGNSTCCGQGFACLSNNLCMLTSHVPGVGPGHSTYVRGSCTDKTWTDPNCPLFCLNSASGDTPSGAMGLAKCNSTQQDWYYCLDAAHEKNTDGVNCGTGANVIAFQGSPSTVTIIGIRTSTASSASSTATIASPTTSATPASNDTRKDTSAHLGLSIGAGIGVPLGLIAISAIGYWIWRAHRARMQVGTSDGAQESNHRSDAWMSEKRSQLSIYTNVQPSELDSRSPQAFELEGHGRQELYHNADDNNRSN